jgi:hypothetical protein
LSGGTLEQSKCSFHMIQSDWNHDGHPFLKGGTERIPIYLTHSGRQIPTMQKSNYASHKTLGCFINPAYNNTTTWKTLSSKNDSLASLLETNYFNSIEAWTFYTSVYIPSITYSLPITPLTKSQCGQLDVRFLRTVLPRCGYNRNMASAIRYAPFHVGGAGFRQLYVEQGALIVQQIHKFLNSPDTSIGKLLLMTISWTQAFLGTSKCFLTDVHWPIPPSGPSLLLDLRTFLQTINGSIRLQSPPTPKLLRENDRCIMDIAMRQHLWKAKHIQQINSCRRYLQAQTLSDIATLQGTRIQPFAITGTGLPTNDSIRVSLFNQKQPGPPAWKTWRKFLQTISNQHAVLHQPLGNWIVDILQMRHWPTWLYNPSTDTLFSHSHGPYYHRHDYTRPVGFSVRPRTDQLVNTPQGYPTAVTIVMDTLRPTNNFTIPIPALLPSIMLLNHTISMSPWEYQLLEYCTEKASIDTIVSNLEEGNIIMCSDGSATRHNASFGYMIATKTGQRLIAGHGPAPGAFPNSFRSESYGVLATVRWLYRALQIHPPHSRYTIEHHLDNQSVKRRIATQSTETAVVSS